MDARPQRPVRPLHLAGDENLALPAKQSLQQRHKSAVDLLPTIAGAGAGVLKMAAKRTAFGDLSNVHKIVARDDLHTVGKGLEIVNAQKSAAVEDKQISLLRPAQRPSNPAGLKGFLSTNKENAPQHFNGAPVPSSTVTEPLHVLQPKTRHIAKRVNTTAIYHDAPEVQPIQHQYAPTSNAPVHQSLVPRQHKSQPQLKPDAPVLRKTQSRYMPAPLPSGNEEIIPVQLDIIEPQRPRAEQNQGPIIDAPLEDYQSYAPLVQERGEQMVQLIHQDPDVEHVGNSRLQQALPALSEPEEYWEEEEEEEEEEIIYDEQGHTTAHSYKSRGDNTTGGTTTILCPQMTRETLKELELAREIVENSRTADDIEDEAWDTSMVAEYGDEIFAYMRELEDKMLPNPHYMDNQAEIQWSMRAVLMDWLVQVHHRFSLLPETLFLCVNYIDRFLSCKIVSLGKLQLVGATAIFVAAKYEEINCPSVSEIVYMVDHGYSVDEILKAERFMLSMLQFELGWPGPMSFLRRISKADDYDLETRTLAKYFLEVTIMDERFVGSPPSYTAAGSHCLARMMLRKGVWTTAHLHYSGYTYAQLMPLLKMIHECLHDPVRHHGAVYEKYCDKRYKKAAQFVRETMQKGFTISSTRMMTEYLGPDTTYYNRILGSSKG